MISELRSFGIATCGWPEAVHPCARGGTAGNPRLGGSKPPLPRVEDRFSRGLRSGGISERHLGSGKTAGPQRTVIRTRKFVCRIVQRLHPVDNTFSAQGLAFQHSPALLRNDRATASNTAIDSRLQRFRISVESGTASRKYQSLPGQGESHTIRRP